MSAPPPAARPLAGWCVVVTRAREQSRELTSCLEERGARPIELAVIEIADPSDGGAELQRASRRLGEFDWVVLSSVNAVERCWLFLRDAAKTGGPKLAAVGASTAAALGAHGVAVDLVPEKYLAEALVEAFPCPPGDRGGSVLLPSAAGARDVLSKGLSAKGWRVEVVEAYRTVAAVLPEGVLASLLEADVITFASSSAVTSFIEGAGRDRVPPAVACIGPVTAATAARHGLDVDVVAGEQSVNGLVDALVVWSQGRLPKAARR